ncbi:retrotransposon protein, putative, ty3-gypsy subclass [Tanacetum coccineum]
MLEVPTILNDDSVEMVAGGANVEEEASDVSDRSRVVAENVVNTVLGGGLVDVKAAWFSYEFNKEEHEEHLRLILELLKKEKLFIEGFTKVAKVMTKHTQKKVAFEWGDKQEADFQTLKNKLCSAPILALPQGAENFIVYCDASHKGLGAVLM